MLTGLFLYFVYANYSVVQTGVVDLTTYVGGELVGAIMAPFLFLMGLLSIVFLLARIDVWMVEKVFPQ